MAEDFGDADDGEVFGVDDCVAAGGAHAVSADAEEFEGRIGRRRASMSCAPYISPEASPAEIRIRKRALYRSGIRWCNFQRGPTSMFRSFLIRCRALLLLAVMGLSVFVAAQVQAPSGNASEPFVADDRLEIPAVYPTEVAEPNEIAIVIRGSGWKTILTDQTIHGDDPYGMAGGEQTPALLHHADGSAYVNIVQIRLGKLTIRFTAAFADGALRAKA